jgi:hypothetical protein
VLSGGRKAGVQFGGDAAEEYQVFIQLVLQLGFVDGKLEQPTCSSSDEDKSR